MTGPVTVRLWGTTIGHLGYAPGQTELATFEYDADFARSGIQLAPLTMPCPPLLHRFDALSQRTFKGVPGIFADSLPDKFGRQLIDLFVAERGLLPERITTLDRLLYVGSRGMGALEYEPSEALFDEPDSGLVLPLAELAELAGTVVRRHGEQQTKLLSARNRARGARLLRVGGSAGGARAKALVAEVAGKLLDGTVDQGPLATYHVLKFDVAGASDRDGEDALGMTRVEYVYSRLARELGIDVPSVSYVEDGKDFHFLIERFDRRAGPDKLERLHYASWCGLAHAHRDETGAYGYEQLVQAARRLDLGQAAVTEIFRRALFNIVGRNQDDHTKNFGFLMDRAGVWRLAPAFDLTYAYDPAGAWTRTHQLRLSNKQDGFTWDDVLAFGKFCNLKERQVRELTQATVGAFAGFAARASEAGVRPRLRRLITQALRLDVGPRAH